MVDFAELITNVIASGASDLHLSVGAPPVMRLNGELVRLGDTPLTAQDTRELVYGLLNQDQRQRLETDLEIDFSYAVPGRVRFRVNAYYQRASLGAAFRVVPSGLKTLEELSLPPALREWTTKPRGLVLVTGPTGSGKSTTLAALIDEINETRACHIMTVEDPIEFLHRHKQLDDQPARGRRRHALVRRTRCAASLRQDPDVILVGEMRDLETIADRPHRRRDRPPGVRHAAHLGRAADDRPHHRRLPAAPAGAGPHACSPNAPPGRLLPAAAADALGRPHRRLRGADARRRPSAT